jgi:predicted RecB family nuclease
VKGRKILQLSASDIYTYYRPKECGLRVYLRHRGEEESSPTPYDEVLRRLGERHERAHLEMFPSFIDLSHGTREERYRQTVEEVGKKSPVIYQPALRTTKDLSGIECEFVGDPDFLIHSNGRYIIRDSKISRRITESDHPEIFRQLELYGWLFEQTFGQPPLALEVHSGTAEIVEVPYDGGESALGALREIVALKQASLEPYSPVGWSKCDRCGFRPYCWPRAEEKRDVALLPDVDQNLAIALREEGIETIPQLLATFDESLLSELKRLWGGRDQRVGKKAGPILRVARAMSGGKELFLQAPHIPDYRTYVMFDLEGLPPQLDELDKIYLWGFQVFGDDPGEYVAATAGFGKDGDQQGWEEFLTKVKDVFDQYGDLPFVHWHHYERNYIKKYIDRYGDRDNVAARVLQNLLDLHPITKESIALPISSYSLKEVEKSVGFQRTQDEYGGEWAMAMYIEATETEDERKRSEVLEQIKTYNKEDLEATWAVLKWLKSMSR